MDQTISLTAYEAMLRNVSVKAVAIAGETPTVGAGAAGVFVDIYLLNHPITDAHGADKGCKGNTSISITAGGTTLVNEVSATKLDSEMANGDYWVNYLTGKIHCKKGDSGGKVEWRGGGDFVPQKSRDKTCRKCYKTHKRII